MRAAAHTRMLVQPFMNEHRRRWGVIGTPAAVTILSTGVRRRPTVMAVDTRPDPDELIPPAGLVDLGRAVGLRRPAARATGGEVPGGTVITWV